MGTRNDVSPVIPAQPWLSAHQTIPGFLCRVCFGLVWLGWLPCAVLLLAGALLPMIAHRHAHTYVTFAANVPRRGSTAPGYPSKVSSTEPVTLGVPLHLGVT